MSDECICEELGYSFLGCLQNTKNGELDESVSLFISGYNKNLEVRTAKSGFYVQINYCPFCGKPIERE